MDIKFIQTIIIPNSMLSFNVESYTVPIISGK